MRRSSGIPSLAAMLVDDAISDYLYAPKDSAAYRTAHKFINGGECKHIVCSECMVESDWRTGECPPSDGTVPCECPHGWDKHLVMVFDWTEHRDVIVGAAGIEPEALRGAICTPVPIAEGASSPPSTLVTSKTVSPKS